MSLDSSINRLAFRLTLYFVIWILVAAASAYVLVGVLHGTKTVPVLLLVSIFFGLYYSVRRALLRVMPAEGLQIVKSGNLNVDPKNAIWSFIWGWYWRLMLIDVVTQGIASAVVGAINAASVTSFIFSIGSVYLSALWLFKYQYGGLTIVPKERSVIVDSAAENLRLQLEELSGRARAKQDVGIMKKISDLFGSALGFCLMALYLIVPLGDIYWLWMSLKIGSFWMFVLGLFPLTLIPTTLIGAYGLVFGMPEWVYRWFG